ncbi:MAG: M23 family metallopeptidase [Microbacteriaceae bacterium]|nr:M23 family metallopeptidase [Microbacteriaceae bacterium]
MRQHQRSGALAPTRQRRRRPGTARRLVQLATAVGASLALIVGTMTLAPTTALADQYPTWNDVQKAKRSQAATQAEVTRVTNLVKSLQAASARAQADAQSAGAALQKAQSDFFAADQKYQSLKAQAAQASAAATAANTRAGRVAAQLYRSGGHNMTMSLLFASAKGSATDPTDLLADLGSMTKLTESTSQLWSQADQAKNTAAAASAQAKVALDERTTLQQQAQTAFTAAVAASAAADQAAADEQAHSDTLDSMLAALKNKTAKTVAGYQKGVQVRAEQARQRKLAAERAAAAAAAKASQVSASGWVAPIRGWITAGFGPRPAPCAGCSTWHEGVDIADPAGTPTHAAHAGTVVYAGWYGDYGNFILIDDGDGVSTAYGHNIDGGIVVSVGQHVVAGQVIGHVGSTGHSTGPHLHFEVRLNGVQINPIPWMSQHGAPL